MSNFDPIKQVNSSGFPFQLRVEHEINTTSDRHKWFVVAQEHRWVNQESKEEGFIDLILQKGHPKVFVVIECKRMKNGNLIFLSSPPQIETYETYILVRSHSNPGNDVIYWVKGLFEPGSFESSFCTVPGQNDKDTPMLERIADQLLNSVESLAEEELKIGQKSTNGSKSAIFVPVIVTNTDLKLCKFDPGIINLAEGELPDNASNELKTLPYIRFRKSLSTRFDTLEAPDDLRKANKESQRTVFVVNASHLANFLSQWGVF